ncbi:MAG: cell wall hydrolase [Alphaproteobacteria bacterium]|nr:cell wall hydrolase [Alphaproteobacteria bacterium]
MRLLGAALVCSSFAVVVPATAGTQDAAAEAMKANVLSLLPGAVAMAPIPDEPAPSAEAPASNGLGEKNCLATAIYFEARGESTKGQKAVAEVVLARTRVPGRPKTVCGVVYEGASRATGCQFSFTCDGISDVVRDERAWRRAKRVAGSVLRTHGRGRSVSRGATFYHADSVRPYWASSMVKVARIGSHIFYRP